MTRPTTSRSEADDVTDPLEVVDDAAADSPAERTTAPRWRRALPILMASGTVQDQCPSTMMFTSSPTASRMALKRARSSFSGLPLIFIFMAR